MRRRRRERIHSSHRRGSQLFPPGSSRSTRRRK